MYMSRGSQRGRLLLFFNKGHRLARALFEQNSIRFDFSSIQFDSISARARIVVRICVRFQLELELWLEFVSKFELIGIRNRIEKLLENACLSWLRFDCKSFENNSKLNWLRLQKFRKQFEKMERADIKTQCW